MKWPAIYSSSAAHKFICIVGLFASLARPSHSIAQQPSQAAQKAAREVPLDVIIRDKHGRLIRDIKPEELEVTEDGSSVKVEAVSFKAPNAPVSAKAVNPDRLERIHAVSIVFDSLNSVSARPVRQAIADLFRELEHSDVYFSMWQMRDRLELVQPFTNSQTVLRDALDSITRAGRTSSPAAAGQPPQEATTDVLGSKLNNVAAKILQLAEPTVADQRYRPSIAGLSALASAQSSLPGHKIVLYLSNGLKLSTARSDEVQAIVGKANRARVSIYAVDTGSLSDRALDDAWRIAMVTPDVNASVLSAVQQSANFGTIQGGKNKVGQPPPAMQKQLKRLSAETGGLYIRELSDLRKSTQHIAEDATTYYEITYVPETEQADGHFRTISVKVDRPHAKIQSPAGWFALPNSGTELELEPFEIPMIAALSTPERSETIWFESEVLHFESTANGQVATLLVQVPLNGLMAHEDDNAHLFSFHLSLLALIKSRNGHVVQKLSRDVVLQGALERLQQSRTGVFTFERPFEIPAGDYYADVVIADQNATKLSAKTLNFSEPMIPHARTLQLSDIVIVREFEPVASGSTNSDPLYYEAKRIIPEVNVQARKISNRDLPVFFTIYPEPDNSDKPRVTLKLAHDKNVVEVPSASLPATKPGEPIPLLTFVHSSLLDSGDYKLTVHVRQGETSCDREIDFSLTGESAALPSSSQTLQERDDPEPSSFSSLAASAKLIPGAPSPRDDEIRSIISGAGERVLDYKHMLPNFLCIKITRRSVDASGRGLWKSADSFTNLLRYANGKESTVLLDIDGRRAGESDSGRIEGATLSGEFGELLNMVFSQVQTNPVWLGMAEIHGARTHVFRFNVNAARSTYQVIAGKTGPAIDAAYHALVYIDVNTLGVRRIAIEAEEIPRNFPIRESAVMVDYDYIPIGGHDFLLPLEASLYVRQGAHYLRRNDIEYRNYRKFSADSTLKLTP